MKKIPRVAQTNLRVLQRPSRALVPHVRRPNKRRYNFSDLTTVRLIHQLISPEKILNIFSIILHYTTLITIVLLLYTAIRT